MSPSQARQSLKNMLVRSGETVALQRGPVAGGTSGTPIGLLFGITIATGGAVPYLVRARIMNITPTDVVGSIQQLKRKAIVSAEDVEAAGFPLPFQPKEDRLTWNGKTLVIVAVDDGTRRVQGQIVGYELELAGA